MELGQIGLYLFIFLGLYFEVFLLITFLEKRPEKKTILRPTHYPSVAIIVPVWNEEKTLAGTLQSILSLDYPKQKLSVIVVNDGSTDNTLSIARGFEKDEQIAVFTKENGGKYTALNLGIQKTKAELIGCLDADSFVTEDALLEVVKKFEENPNIMAVTPAMKVHRPHSPLELMQAVEYTFGIFYKKMFGNLAAISVLPGPFSIYRRDVFDRLGLFRHAHNTEDMEMAFRMHAGGLRIENAHTSVVYTKVPRTIPKLLRQRTRWSQGFLQNARDYKHMLFKPQFGYFGLLTLPFGLAMFFGALYSTVYILWHVVDTLTIRILNLYATRIPPHLPLSGEHLSWFYLNTSMLTMLALLTVVMTLIAIIIGRRIAGADFGFGSLISYFTLYTLIAPLWLAQAFWGALRAQESKWR